LLPFFSWILISARFKVGSTIMRAKGLIVSLLTLAISFSFTSIPASANDAPVIDYCAKKTTGKVRAITEGACTKNERSLGATPIVRSETRPKALVPQVKNRYEAAKAAAKKKGHTLAITSGYRSLQRQEVLFQRAIKRHGSVEAASKWVLPPEKSNHPWGLAIDINYGVGGTKGKKAAAWLEKNGYQYGLCRRYENEWWHFEPLVAPGQKCPAMEPYAS
jgi:D-alanyl-D-alanine dipeptidase